MKSYVKFAYELFKSTVQGNLTFAYQGEFNPEITDKLLMLTERNLTYIQEKRKVRKKVFKIMVECLQNITKHQSEDKKLARKYSSVFVVRKIDEIYYISTGNPVRNGQVEMLRNKLDKVNELSQEELKEFYRDVLAKGTFSEKGGAGLGLIDIAKKSNQELRYKFEPIDDDYSYYYLQTQLPTSPDVNLGDGGEIDKGALDTTLRFHQTMLNRNLLLFYVGEFNQSIVLNVLGMTDQNMYIGLEDNQTRKNVFSIIIEMLQNVSRHAQNVKREKSSDSSGVFLISEVGGEYLLSTGNLVEQDNVESLKKRLKQLEGLNKDQLHELYDKELAAEQSEEEDRARLGLIDLALRSENRLKYEFHDHNDSYWFFFLEVRVPRQSKSEKD